VHFSRRPLFLENASCESFSVGLEVAESGVDGFGNVLPGGFRRRVPGNPSESLEQSYAQEGNRPVAEWNRLSVDGIQKGRQS
jgi:hypothetical protein